MTFHLSTNKHLELFRKALFSYSLAEKHFPIEFPDLLYNKGSVLCYLQDYLEAEKCFTRAHHLDETLNAQMQIHVCRVILNRIKKDFFDRFFQESLLNKIVKALKLYEMRRGAVMQRGISKFKKMNSQTKHDFELQPFSKFNKGKNPKYYCMAKVLKIIYKTESGINMFLVMDQNKDFAVMSIFGGVEGLEQKIELKVSVVLMINPERKMIQTGEEGDRAQLLMFQIFNQDDLIIDNMKVK
jgi:tetratricopeptide (TPR) repeat protein